MKKLPISIIPILGFIVLILTFLFLPKGSNLISNSGDYVIGEIMGFLLGITLIIDIVRFFKRKNKKVDPEKEEILKNPEIQKTKNLLKNTGNSIYAVGWFTIIVNIALYIWGIFDKNYPTNLFPRPDLAATLLVVAMMFVFIVLGDRIRKLKDIQTKLYLQILLVLSFIFLIGILFIGGKVGIILFIIIAYLIMSLVSINKAMKMEEFTSTLTNPQYKLDKNGWKTFAGVVAILFFIVYGFEITHPKIPEGESIDQIVQEVKADSTFPKRIDSYTTIVDIQAEPNAIRYFYIINDIDPTKLSDEIIKSTLIKSVCTSTMEAILNREINIEYFYSVQNSPQTYLVSFTKADCSQ